MVVIHVKRTDRDQFLFETTCAESNDALIRKLVEVWNLRLLLQRLADAVDELAKHGPSRPDDERGLDEGTIELAKRVEAETRAAGGGGGGGGGGAAGGGRSRGPHFNPDPSAQRTGDAPAPTLQETLHKVAEDARQAVDANNVLRKVALTVGGLREHLRLIGGAVTMAFPMGLPEYDPIRAMLAESEDLAGHAASLDVLDPETATLWCAGKEFVRDQTVADRLGRNEKTKVVAKLQPKGSGPPAREPAVSEEERRAMLAFVHKRNEEMKRLADDDEDGYLEAKWADPKALKGALLGTGGSLAWRPGGR